MQAPHPYDLVRFRPERNGTLDTLRWARKRHGVPLLVEVDVTRARDTPSPTERRWDDSSRGCVS